MSTSYSPKIVTDSLIFLLDASNPKCFQSGWTQATDLIGGKPCYGASGTPGGTAQVPVIANMPTFSSYNKGVFYFNNTTGINVGESLGSHSALSYSVWFYKTSTGGDYFFDARNNGGVWFLSNYDSYNINWNSNMRYNFQAPYSSNPTGYLNNWYHMLATSDSSGTKLFLNGVEMSLTTSNSTTETLGINLRIGTRYTFSSHWVGYMGPIAIYNKKMTAENALLIYNQHKSRFMNGLV
jgi:hypothetical protein